MDFGLAESTLLPKTDFVPPKQRKVDKDEAVLARFVEAGNYG